MHDNGNELVPFAVRVAGGDKLPDDGPADAGELAAPGNVYATVTGPRLALSIEFARRDGSSFCVPYACLPLLWWRPPGRLIVEYPGLFSVLLRGKELDELRRLIKDQRVTRIREFDEHDAAALASVVTRIDILRAFPSREAGEGTGSTPGADVAN
jgi:hypothetical protein